MGLIDDGSIFMTIKRLLNIDPEEMAFDTQIGAFINEEFMTLHQLGIGPDEGFHVSDANTKWTDFSDDKTLIDTLKTYIFYRVRMVFDPPASSIVADSYNSRISELQFRLNCQAERNYIADHPEEFAKSEDPFADEPTCDCANKKIYTIKGENLTIFETPTRLEGG